METGTTLIRADSRAIQTLLLRCENLEVFILHGLEALHLSDKDLEELSKFQRKNIRCIQHLPKSTAPSRSPSAYQDTGDIPRGSDCNTRNTTRLLS